MLVGQATQDSYRSMNIDRRVDDIVKTLNDNLTQYERLNSVKSTLDHRQYQERAPSIQKLRANLSQNKFKSSFYPVPLDKPNV